MENTIQVKPLRTFHGDEGFKTSDSEPFAVSRQRFADLKANGLVEEFKGTAPTVSEIDHKVAPTAKNKMAAESSNKAEK